MAALILILLFAAVFTVIVTLLCELSIVNEEKDIFRTQSYQYGAAMRRLIKENKLLTDQLEFTIQDVKSLMKH